MSHRKISFCERIHIYFSKLFLSQSDASVKKISETIQMFERWMRNLKYFGKVCFLLLEIVARRCFGTTSFLKNWYRKLLDCCVCVVLSLWEFALLLVNVAIWYPLKRCFLVFSGVINWEYLLEMGKWSNQGTTIGLENTSAV